MSDDPRPATEHVNPATRDLDLLATPELVATLIRDNAVAVEAVAACSAQIAAAVDRIVARLDAGGRLHYVGAGTSGRLGILDAAECPPTFGTPPDLVQGHIAGGAVALLRAVEGAEDDAQAGALEIERKVAPADAVVGISASGGARFVVAALQAARTRGALTVAVTNAPGSRLEAVCELAIVLETGAEALAGSTRLKAGTAQKLTLNAISTAVMVRRGRVHGNLMVDVTATNAKLRRRALDLVVSLVPTEPLQALKLLAAAGGSVKVAVVMGRRGIDAPAARGALARAGGRLRAALDAPSGS